MLVKPFAFCLMMALGYFGKQHGWFHEQEKNFLMKLVMNVTLPLTVLHSFASLPQDTSCFLIVLVGFGCAFLPFLIVWFCSRKKERSKRVFYMMNVSGYNIGCFSLPIIQSFFGGFGAIIACLFDTGNAIMATGGAYAMTSILLKDKTQSVHVRVIIKRFVSSIPFDAYLISLFLILFQVQLPSFLIEVSEPFANANAFLAMVMLGMMLQIMKNKEDCKQAVLVVLLRLGFALILAMILYQFTFLDLETRKVLMVVVFAPISTLAPMFTGLCKGNEALSGFANSLSILVGLVVMCLIVLL